MHPNGSPYPTITPLYERERALLPCMSFGCIITVARAPKGQQRVKSNGYGGNPKGPAGPGRPSRAHSPRLLLLRETAMTRFPNLGRLLTRTADSPGQSTRRTRAPTACGRTYFPGGQRAMMLTHVPCDPTGNVTRKTPRPRTSVTESCESFTKRSKRAIRNPSQARSPTKESGSR